MVKRPKVGERFRVTWRIENSRELERPRSTVYTVVEKWPFSIVGKDDKGNEERFENQFYKFTKI